MTRRRQEGMAGGCEQIGQSGGSGPRQAMSEQFRSGVGADHQYPKSSSASAKSGDSTDAEMHRQGETWLKISVVHDTCCQCPGAGEGKRSSTDCFSPGCCIEQGFEGDPSPKIQRDFAILMVPNGNPVNMARRCKFRGRRDSEREILAVGR